MKPVRNTFMGRIPVVKKEFLVAMDIKVLAKAAGSYLNIFRMAVTGLPDNGVYGARIPGIWLYPRSSKLHITSAVSGNSNKYFNTADLPLNKFSSIAIQQRRQYGDKYK